MQVRSSRTQAERREATRRQLLAAAKTLFVAHGFAQTSTPEVAQLAGVTRGALYHHFEDKCALFLAVAMQAAHEVACSVEQASSGPLQSPFEALKIGARAYFEAMSGQGRARLLLLEAPAVLSSTQLLALSQAAGAEALHAGLREALGIERVPEPQLTALADMMSAAFDRAALAVVQGAPLAHHLAATVILLDGLQAWLAKAPVLREG